MNGFPVTSRSIFCYKVEGVYLMRKTRVILLLLGLYWFFGQGAWAQEGDGDDSDISRETDWEVYVPSLYSRGDQTFAISLGVTFPIVFLNNGRVMNHNFKPFVGGTGSLAYNYFFDPVSPNSNFFLGGEIGVKLNNTLGQNTVFLIPIGLRTGWQFIIRRFEFPLTLTVGVVPHRYLNLNYIGLFVKGGASAYFRFNP
jgi:hypothetical protein